MLNRDWLLSKVPENWTFSIKWKTKKNEFAIMSGSNIYFLCQIKNASVTICQSTCVLSVKATSFGSGSKEKKDGKLDILQWFVAFSKQNFNAMNLKLIISCLVPCNNWRYNRGKQKQNSTGQKVLITSAWCKVQSKFVKRYECIL